MATNNTIDKLSISRTDSGFPAYLDFTTLRTSAINYLGPITSGYWTDYNIHDPGITTLEALLYALMDLGYRVNFPIVDLLTPAPGATKNIDFFTPAQILGGNPLTMNDYRKKLMDLTEVRNAWLDAGAGAVGPNAGSGAAGTGTSVVQGVYSVFLELEMDRSDFPTDQQWEAYRDKVVQEVQGVLQAHRNLCEDFAEPVVLSRKPVSVNADIELADGASPVEVYRQLVRALYIFFSPAPRYHTLGQLVQMGIPLDEVFAGRPYEKWPSHGFILDADLPQRPSGRMPIYLSAVYHQLLEIPGVKTVRRLSLDKVGEVANGVQPAWTEALAEDVLPVLDIAGSQFRWYRGGQLLAAELGSETLSLEQEVTHDGKIFYPASDLDVAIPTGRWLEGLNKYYSIQNDYPQVYGIGPGGLPGTASAERQAQALQLKGYLLLFDQLLADYLAQLGNIQTLFSMSGGGLRQEAPGAGGGGATYFAGDVSSVPGLTPLLRFPPAAGAGTMLAYPVAAGDWEAFKGGIGCARLNKLTPFTYPDAADRDVALAQLALLFSVETPTVSYIPVDEKQVVYVITGIGNDFVLISQSRFPDVASASKEAATVLFIGGAKENYNPSVLTGDDGSLAYSFSLVQTGAAYTNYVQALLESPAQYTQRRTAFLEHLMDRFAESFTDYALLSAGFLTQQEIAGRRVGLIEEFLGNFPALSGNRGQAYNYTQRSWDTGNISGLEKRFMSYSGITDKRRHWLCCFEVGEVGSPVQPDAASKPEGFVYRLTDKNHPGAYHPMEWKTAEEAAAVRETLIAKAKKGYRYPEICLGGDNVYFRERGAGGGWHFLLRCRNDYFSQIGLSPDQEWTMFESVAGFDSADAAQQAFQDQYLSILGMAMDGVNFGDTDFIGWSDQSKAVVFVPKELQDAMNDAGLDTANELVRAAKAYPIRKKDRFIFLLVNDETGETDWESAGAFADAQEAHVAFDYFRLLLNVGGNYFTDYDDELCGFRLALREVLAESVTRYSTADAAWRAIEEFVTVSQSSGGIHPEKRNDGSWGFFVAGADLHARHPCRYETGQLRDTALEQLFTAAQGFHEGGWFSGTDMISLLDLRTGEAVAQFPSPGTGPANDVVPRVVTEMADAVLAGQFLADEQGLYVPADGASVKIRPVDKDVTRDKWEEQLLQYIAWFPVVRNGNRYGMEMKLPGFAAESCFAAWVGPASFPNAADAWKAFLAFLPLLGELSWYRSVHGGPGDYGIELYKPDDILAFNPQTYTYAEMAARGLDRAKDCINMEGIQLVEHLLLRPEKGVKTAIPMCPPATPLPGFTTQPGLDPYSFILTAFLPAWPERFRKKENRQVLERRLQEETPVHILLRILWLTPMDMCRWESQYKDWLRSLEPEKPCADYSADEWVKMLFAEPIQCLVETSAEVGKSGDSDEWLNGINLLYCWKDRECADTSKWNFDVPKTGPAGGGIQFKPSPTPAGQSVGSATRLVMGSTTEVARKAGDLVDKVKGIAGKAEDLVDKVKGVADKAGDVVNKVQDATDKVHDVSNRLKEVENIAKDVIPLVVEEIPVVGPVISAAERVAVRVGLWTKVLHKGVDILEGLLNRLKGLLEKGGKK